jgi:hypothetical protein
VVLPTDGTLRISYSALWKETVLDAAGAAIFIGANQLKAMQINGAPAVQEADLGSTSGVNFYVPLRTLEGGMSSLGGALTADSTTVTTGLPVSVCEVEAAAGTYTCRSSSRRRRGR